MSFMDVMSLLGGVAFFLFGMESMGNGLKSLAGNKMEAILWKLSSTPIKGFLLGIFVTAVIQSSGATTVMVISFVSAGMMTLSQAVPIVLGTNIGTTMTGWILTLSDAEGSLIGQLLSTEMLISIFALMGALPMMFSKKHSHKSVGMVLIGLATILLSMSLISDSVAPLKSSDEFRRLLVVFENPFLGMLAGIAVAAIIQSCSAGVGILQALSTSGMAIPYCVCLPVILGIKIGASSPVLISMVGGNRNSKRTALVYLFANILTAALVFAIFYPINAIAGFGFMKPLDDASVAGGANVASSFGLAVINSLISVIGMIVLFPLHSLIEKLCMLVIKQEPSENEDMSEIDNLDDTLLNYAPAALEVSKKAALRMCTIAKKNLFRSIKLLSEYDASKYQKVQDKETLCDKYEDKLGNYIVKISKNSLDDKQQAISSELLSVIGDLERLSDHAANISESANEIYEKKITFSEDAQKEISLLIEATGEILILATTSFCERRRDLAVKVEPLEEVIDEMTKLFKANHIDRVSQNSCTIVTGFVYNDLLTNFERVADHCSNIAFAVMHSYDINAEEHNYSANISISEQFKNDYNAYTEKFLKPIIGSLE